MRITQQVYAGNSKVLFPCQVVVDVTNTTALEVPLRSSRLYSIDFNITFDGDEGYMA